MGAKVSTAMQQARALIEKGMTAYEAARQCGITRGAISRAKWYRDHIAGQAPEQSTQDRARELVVDQGMTAYEAAQHLGIAQSTISRAQWYREYRNA